MFAMDKIYGKIGQLKHFDKIYVERKGGRVKIERYFVKEELEETTKQLDSHERSD